MITRFADRTRVSTLLACLSLAGVAACSSEGDDPLGDRGGAATNDPTFDLRAVSPALSPTIVEGGSFAWSVTVSNTGTTRFENRVDPAVVRLEVTGNGEGSLSAGAGCDSFEPNVWLCSIVTLPVGDSRGYSVNVVAGTVGTITLTATVTPLADADPSNNTAIQTVEVVGLEPCPDPGPCMEFTNNPRKRCEMAPKPVGTACEEAGCLAGVCDAQGACSDLASKCEDGACTTSTCDATTNTCVTGNKPDGLACASSNNCDGPGRCEAGACNGDDSIVCDDGNSCTTDSCVMGENRRYTCQHEAKVCPGYGDCGDGVCNPETGACDVVIDNARCDDGIACTDDLCTSSGCTNVPKHDRCSDSNLCDALLPLCDENLGCIETECRPRIHGDCSEVEAKNCDDSNACTTDSCNPATGTCSNSAIVCNDNNNCTNDSCNLATGTCQFTPKGCDDGNACTIDSCDLTTGQCKNVAKNCDDGVSCTADSCVNGACVNAPRNTECSDGNACNGAETCDATRGCVPGTPVTCDDNNGCTTDSCNPTTGACTNAAVTCNDNNSCTNDSCNPATGTCTYAPKSCDDGNACTIDSCDLATGQCRNVAKSCDDGVACTADSCVAGACVNTPRNDQCGDGNACNGAETCDATRGCVAGEPTNCDDGNACTTDACNPTTGQCSNTGVTCNDNNPCTVDSCNLATGQCQFQAKSCDDGNGCTIDSCDGATGECRHVAKVCNDQNACTTDSCDATSGQCRYNAITCNDGNSCNGVETCEPSKGCEPGEPLVCNDGNACNGSETCDPAQGCRPGTPVSCDDGNGCTIDSCNAQTGACTNAAKSCDDGNACTIDSCDSATGQCRNVAKSCDDGVACTADSCVAGACVNTPRNDQCGDNNACNGLEVCDATRGCVAGEPKNCNDSNACTNDSCNPANGQCTNSAVSCNDQNPCTVDSCNPTTGQCQFQAKSCDDGNACTIDSCDGATGQCRNVAKSCDDGVACTADSCVAGACVNTPRNDQCGDNNACNGLEICDATRGCVAGEPKNCNDNSVCTTDSCNPTTGQCSNTTVSCDDNNACTIDSCDAVQGCRHVAKSCDDGVACTADSCVAGACVNTPTPSLCSDGNVCNGGETCDATRGCVPGTPLVCNDGNVCTNDSCDPTRGCVTTNNTNPCDDGNACNNACLEWDEEPVAAWTATNYNGGEGAHGFWLPGFNGGNGVTYMTLQPDTKLAWWDDGSAVITGTAVVTQSAGNIGLGDSYLVEMYFTYRGQGANGEGGGGPKMSGLVDYEDTLGWQYFDLTSGFLFGVDDASDFVTFEQYPANSMMPFQLGVGANDKTLDFGAATWLTFDRSYSGGVSEGVGDLNVDLEVYECPTHDMCEGGQCVGRGPVTCDDGDQCTTDSCDAAEGCVSQPYTGACNDGNACTTNDTCGGTCSGTPVTCDDDNACTTDTCDSSAGCLFLPIPDCGGDCAVCAGVSKVTVKLDAWSASRDTNETIRVRQNSASGAVLYSGAIANGSSVEVSVPAGTTSIVLTVQGAQHPAETQKASFAIDCATSVGQTNGNSYVTFKLVDVKQRIVAESCDDGDECTADECTEAGCTNTPIPGCGLCPECVGVSKVTVKVSAWTGTRDQNETVRIRKNSASGTILFSGKIANNGTVTVDVPTDATSIVLTVQGASHANETQKASFAMNCSTAAGASNGNSYITFTLTSVIKRTEGVDCNDNDDCTTDECTATGCTNTPIAGCGLCSECTGVSKVTVKVSAWAGSRDQNETVRIRKNSMSGTVLFSGKIANNGSVTVDVPTGTTSLILTVQGANHTNETQKASFTTDCSLAVGTINGNSYIKFTLTSVIQRTEGLSCDDGDECTTDTCGASGCTHTEIPGCGQCEVCAGVSRVTVKVSQWTSTRDQNETIRIRKNGSSGTILFSGKIANNGSVTVDLPADTTSIALTVQGAYHLNETLKASFTTNCSLATGALNGNSYIKFLITSLVQRTELQDCN